LLGIPVRLVVSEKTGEKVEMKKRESDKCELVDVDKLVERL
jgi:prolyl-tRNA synthetase